MTYLNSYATMRSPSILSNHPEPVAIKLEDGLRQYYFRGFYDHDVLFGHYDTFDLQRKPLDFTSRDVYLPLEQRIPGLRFSSLRQVHGTQIRKIERTSIPFENHGEGDALYTDQILQALTIRTADCLPLFLYSQDFILAAHIGYRGLLDGILEQIEYEINLIPGQTWFAAIGPHIQSCCFEARDQVLKEFESFELCSTHAIMGPPASRFISLKSMVQRWFQDFGSDRMCFDFSTCTFCHVDFHSYRRSRTPFRQGNLIVRIPDLENILKAPPSKLE